MKPPQKPPDISELKEISKKLPERFQKALKLARSSEDAKKYRHWDTLRHLTPPEGLTLKEWWAGMKMHRLGGMKELPLKDTLGNFFGYNVPDSVLEQLHKIDLGSGGSIGVPKPIINPQTRNQYLVRSLIQEAITSSQLEGAVTARATAKDMLRLGRAPKNNNERMILNNFRMMQGIQNWKDQPLDESLILEIHRQVTDQTLDEQDASGRLRLPHENVMVEDASTNEILHTPPPSEELQKRLKALCDFANGKTPSHFVHPVIRAITLHFWLAYDHPFVDGNGRTARALFYWSMLRQGYWLFEYISISEVILRAPSKYAKSFLHTESDNSDLTYFIMYQSKVIEKSLETLHKYIEFKTEQLAKVETLFRSGEIFNHRQEALLAYALRCPRRSFSIDTHRMYHHIAYKTASKDLQDLNTRGYLEMRKEGKTFVFVSPHDLASLISNQETKL